MRFIGVDVHRDFCEVAIAEAGVVRLAGRVQTEPAALTLFAQSLGGDDEVALEATGNALGIARIMAPHVGGWCWRIRRRSRGSRVRARRPTQDRRAHAGAAARRWLSARGVAAG